MFDGKTIWFVVRGNAGSPSNFVEWEYLSRDYIIQNLAVPAVAVSYATTFATVWRNRGMRAQRFAKILNGYTTRDWRVNIMAHSEGSVVGTDALRLLGWPRIENLHLVCGACDHDFQKLGLNDALRKERISAIHTWQAGRDTAMQFESLAIGRILFGIHRPLGLDGPTNVSQQYANLVHEHWESPWDSYGHSDCWLPQNFNRTMDGFVKSQWPIST